MRILLVSHRFMRHSLGGTEVLANDTALWLARNGHAVIWLAVGPEAATDVARRTRPDGVDEWEIPPAFPPDYPVGWSEAEEMQMARVALCFARFPTTGPIDAVHVFHFARIGLRFLDLAVLRDAMFVVTLTDYTAVCPDFQLRDRSSGTICTGKVPARTCLGCIGARTTAAGAAEDVASWRARNARLLSERVGGVYLQTPHQRIVLQGLGMADAPFRDDRAAYHLPADWTAAPARTRRAEYVFGFVGGASEEKGIHVAIEAFSEARAIACDRAYRLKIVSPDPGGQHGAADGIEWLGPVPHAELGRFLGEIDCLLVPSLWLENHPMVLTYALGSGAAVLCSDLPSLRHLRGTPDLFFAPPGNVAAWRQEMLRVGAATDRRLPAPTRLPSFEALMTAIESSYRSTFGKRIGNGE